MILGCTSNTFEDIEKVHQYADYMGLGPFRFTTTKQNLSPVLGLNRYEIIIQQMESHGIKIPVIAIGGILVDDIDDLMAGDALTIPESKDTSRSEISTYVFSFKNQYKKLHMRFSMRKDNIGTSLKASSAVIKLRDIIFCSPFLELVK